jgi:hypothetical protein
MDRDKFEDALIAFLTPFGREGVNLLERVKARFDVKNTSDITVERRKEFLALVKRMAKEEL